MKKKAVAACLIVIALIVAYLGGRFVEAQSVSQSRMKHDLKVYTELLKLDETLLTNAVTRPNTLTSGLYTLETKVAGKPETISKMDFEFSGGRLTRISGNVQDILQSGSVVTWEQYDSDEGPSARFVGVIDGDLMWGRVYIAPGQGWREGDPPEYGVWTLRRASNGTKSTPESVGSHQSSTNSSVASEP